MLVPRDDGVFDRAERVGGAPCASPAPAYLDLAVAQSASGSTPGRLQSLEPDLAAIVTPGLPVAFADALVVTLDRTTPAGERAKRDVQVCGPAAFVVLKAFALRLRGENKDAYDLVYILENYGSAVPDVAARFAAIAGAAEAQPALRHLAEDITSVSHIGPKRRANFIAGADSDPLQADAPASSPQLWTR